MVARHHNLSWAFPRFLDRGVGEANDDEGWHPAGCINLYLDEDPVQAQERTTVNFRQHGRLRWWDDHSVAQTARRGKRTLAKVQWQFVSPG